MFSYCKIVMCIMNTCDVFWSKIANRCRPVRVHPIYMANMNSFAGPDTELWTRVYGPRPKIVFI